MRRGLSKLTGIRARRGSWDGPGNAIAAQTIAASRRRSVSHLAPYQESEGTRAWKLLSDVLDRFEQPGMLKEPSAEPEHTPDRTMCHVKKPRAGATVHHEAELLNACAHPNVIGSYGITQEGELVIEKGEHDLYDHIARSHNCQLPSDQLIPIAEGLADALHHIHEKGYAHNDMKVENVVMCREGDGQQLTPKIIDFEFASAVNYPADESGRIIGTRAYFSPEMWLEEAGYDKQGGDCWALGVTLHLAHCGCFPNMTVEALPILMRDYAAPPDMDPRIATMLEGLLKVDPKERWTTSDVMAFLQRTPGSKSDVVSRAASEPLKASQAVESDICQADVSESSPSIIERLFGDSTPAPQHELG